jgi:hypothetical protein
MPQRKRGMKIFLQLNPRGELFRSDQNVNLVQKKVQNHQYQVLLVLLVA